MGGYLTDSFEVCTSNFSFNSFLIFGDWQSIIRAAEHYTLFLF